jgi:hypothetical protein
MRYAAKKSKMFRLVPMVKIESDAFFWSWLGWRGWMYRTYR